jgi:threonine dehydrogenase-like Zn-dependent dehydrogenase
VCSCADPTAGHLTRDLRAEADRVEVIDAAQVEDVPAAVMELTSGRGADQVIDAVGMEAHGSTAAKVAIDVVTTLPRGAAAALMQTVGVDRMAALETAFRSVRRGGTVSLSGVYGGATDPVNMMKMFDRQVTVRMGQANVRRWRYVGLTACSAEKSNGGICKPIDYEIIPASSDDPA